ncbi:MAG: sulfite exporter TauE/SafE family protein [Rhodocyclales bacterium]|nr:sulfite exporter TauE/SafE family protein [Rhodocyclales bacterium]
MISLVDASLLQLALVCLVAFAASVLSGLSGFGAGLILPVFLAPLVGIANVIPVMAVVVVLNNGGRVVAFWRNVEWLRVRHVLTFGLPACIAGAWAYTLLSSRWIGLLLGAFLLASIPLRRILNRVKFEFSPAGERGAGAIFGFINGGMTGTGVILISILMSAGLEGASLVATDAVVSAVMGIAKIALFGGVSILNPDLAAVGLLVGLCTFPGAFVARRIMSSIPARIHAWIMELVVIVGAVVLLRGATP